MGNEEVIRKKMMMVEEALRRPHTFSDSRELASLLTKSIPLGRGRLGTVRNGSRILQLCIGRMNGTGGGKRILTTPPVTTVRQNLLFGFYEVHYRYKWLRNGISFKPPVAAEKCVSLLLTLLTKASFEEAKRTADDYIQQEGLTADWEEGFWKLKGAAPSRWTLKYFNTYDWGIAVDLFDLYGVEKEWKRALQASYGRWVRMQCVRQTGADWRSTFWRKLAMAMLYGFIMSRYR